MSTVSGIGSGPGARETARSSAIIVARATRTNSIGTKGVPRAEREAQILLAAIDVFAANGYAAAAIVDIADRAGISKPLIYQYFGSKDQLYLRCLAQVSDDLIERIEQTMKREDPSISSLLGTMRAIFEALEPYPSAWRLVFDPSLPAGGLLQSRARAYQARTAALAAIGTERFLRARGNRSSLDASALTGAWINIIHALITWWIDHPRESADAMIQRCARLLAAIVSPEIAPA